MSFSDSKFPYGPFVPHYVAKQYIENYFAIHKTDNLLELNTTVEDLSSVPAGGQDAAAWKLILRKYDPTRHVDIWWEEFFDAVVLANGHYSVPYVRSLYTDQNMLMSYETDEMTRRRRLRALNNTSQNTPAEYHIPNSTALL